MTNPEEVKLRECPFCGGNMPEKVKLRECPFCGSPAEYLHPDTAGYENEKSEPYVCCSFKACKMYNLYFTIRHWNTRPKAKGMTKKRIEEILEKMEDEWRDEKYADRNGTCHKSKVIATAIFEEMESCGVCGNGEQYPVI